MRSLRNRRSPAGLTAHAACPASGGTERCPARLSFCRRLLPIVLGRTRLRTRLSAILTGYTLPGAALVDSALLRPTLLNGTALWAALPSRA